jgi:hypothetical protein
VTSETLNESVLASMCFIRDDNNISPVRKGRIFLSFAFGQKLLDRGEDHAAGRNAQ